MDEQSIFLEALEKPTAGERLAWLQQSCGSDEVLRKRVEALLRRYDDAGSFLERPPDGVELEQTVWSPGDTHEDHPPRLSPDDWTVRYQGGSKGENRDEGNVSLGFLHPSEDPGSLGRIGQYEALSVVGQGGMGIVFKAQDTRLKRVVAVKVLAPELSANPVARQRFLREAYSAAAVTHPHVVAIHAVDEDHVPYLVMEFVDGHSLRDEIERKGALEVDAILHIGAQIAGGLAAAHTHGLIHRDIKPANILLDNSAQRVKITDFGLARAVDDLSVTSTGEVAGTPQFMSPEQALGEHTDHRSDLFCLGCVLYAMGTGRPPFRGDNPMAVMRRVIDETPRPIREMNTEIPDSLGKIIDKLLEKRPEDRFQSAAEVALLLEQLLAHLQHPSVVLPPDFVVAARPAATVQPEPGGPFQNSGFRLRRLIAGGLAALVLLAGIIFIQTKTGQFVIETDDPDIAFRVTSTGVKLEDRKAKRAYDLKVGRHDPKTGEYELEVTDELAGLGFTGKTFTLKRGEKVALKAWFKAAVATAGTTDSSPKKLAGSTEGEVVKDGENRRAKVQAGSSSVAISPFDEKPAQVRQETWARRLGIEVEIINTIGMKLRLIPPGEFLMGSSAEEPGHAMEELQHEVAISKPFYMGTHEVTVGQFAAFIKETGHRTDSDIRGFSYRHSASGEWEKDPRLNWKQPAFEQTAEHPVVCVSWDDAKAFCAWLSEKEKKSYRLPTEAQWEYGCRAGSRTRFPFGNEEDELVNYGWYKGNSDLKTHPIGEKKSNAWGLHDMLGNAREHVGDWYASDYFGNSPREDPSGPDTGITRMLRGGSWYDLPNLCRSAYRSENTYPSIPLIHVGFRVVLVDL